MIAARGIWPALVTIARAERLIAARKVWPVFAAWSVWAASILIRPCIIRPVSRGTAVLVALFVALGTLCIEIAPLSAGASGAGVRRAWSLVWARCIGAASVIGIVFSIGTLPVSIWLAALLRGGSVRWPVLVRPLVLTRGLVRVASARAVAGGVLWRPIAAGAFSGIALRARASGAGGTLVRVAVG